MRLPGPARRRRCSRRSGRRLASAELPPGSNYRSRRTAPRRRRPSLRAGARGRARTQGGTYSVMRASIPFRVDGRTGVEPLDRRRGRQDGPLATQASTDLRTPSPRSTALAVLRRGATRRAHARRRPRTTGIRTGGAAPRGGARVRLWARLPRTTSDRCTRSRCRRSRGSAAQRRLPAARRSPCRRRGAVRGPVVATPPEVGWTRSEPPRRGAPANVFSFPPGRIVHSALRTGRR